MLRSLEDLANASVVATDGKIGKVSNFLFDDHAWSIRYLVVDVGGWITRRDVVIPIVAVAPPDWTSKTLHVNLTKKQVSESPDVDSTKPVSRQQEIAMREYFGWPAYWESGSSEFPRPSLAAGRTFPVHTNEDSQLRSAEEVTGYEVWSEESDIGRVQSFIVNEASWQIGYLDVKAGHWLHQRSILVSTHSVLSVSWADHRVNIDHA